MSNIAHFFFFISGYIVCYIVRVNDKTLSDAITFVVMLAGFTLGVLTIEFVFKRIKRGKNNA